MVEKERITADELVKNRFEELKKPDLCLILILSLLLYFEIQEGKREEIQRNLCNSIVTILNK